MSVAELEQALLDQIYRCARSQWWRWILVRQVEAGVVQVLRLFRPPVLQFHLYRHQGQYTLQCESINPWDYRGRLVLDLADPACLQQLRQFVLQQIRR